MNDYQKEKNRIFAANGFCGKEVNMSRKHVEKKPNSTIVNVLTALLSEFNFELNTDHQYFEEGESFQDYNEDFEFEHGKFKIIASVEYTIQFTGSIEEWTEGEYKTEMEAMLLSVKNIEPLFVAFFFDAHNNGEFEEVELSKADSEILAESVFLNIIKQNKINELNKQASKWKK